MRSRTLILALTLPLAVTACNGGTTNVNRSLDSVHQPVITQQNLVLDVNTVNGEMPPSEQARLDGWFDAMGVSYGDRVSIDDSAGYGNASALATIAAMVSRRGLMLSSATPITIGQLAPGAVRVVVMRSSAAVPGCPDWSTTSATDFSSGTSSNYGCANNANLAAMVADPQDLVKGQAGALNDPLTASKAIGVYRERPPTGKDGLKANDTTAGGKK